MSFNERNMELKQWRYRFTSNMLTPDAYKGDDKVNGIQRVRLGEQPSTRLKRCCDAIVALLYESHVDNLVGYVQGEEDSSVEPNNTSSIANGKPDNEPSELESFLHLRIPTTIP